LRIKANDAVRALPEESIYAALIKFKGIIADAAYHLGVDRTALSARINTNPELKELKNENRERTLDMAESMLFAAIADPTSKNHITALVFYLKCRGKERGYVERQEITGKDGLELGQVVAPIRALNAAEWALQNSTKGSRTEAASTKVSLPEPASTKASLPESAPSKAAG
jgi:hypothetical protein